jgi:CheY-like chemotaxis protein
MTPRAENAATEEVSPDLKSILLVEDDINDVLLACREFSKLQLLNPVLHVASCEEMIDYMTGEGDFSDREKYPLPALILLDMHLTHADGLDAATWLRSKLKYRNIPIIAISGSADKGPKLQNAVEMGAHEAMTKPLRGPDFLKVARKLRVALEFSK